jgi:hypothetical protein
LSIHFGGRSDDGLPRGKVAGVLSGYGPQEDFGAVMQEDGLPSLYGDIIWTSVKAKRWEWFSH